MKELDKVVYNGRNIRGYAYADKSPDEFLTKGKLYLVDRVIMYDYETDCHVMDPETGHLYGPFVSANFDDAETKVPKNVYMAMSIVKPVVDQTFHCARLSIEFKSESVRTSKVLKSTFIKENLYEVETANSIYYVYVIPVISTFDD